MRGSLKLAVWITAACGAAFAQCEVSTPVRQLLDKPEFRPKMIDTPADVEARNTAYRKALADYPDNYFVLRSQIRSFQDPPAALKWAQGLRREHPDRVVYEMIEAEAMLGRDTPEAIRRLEALAAKHPNEGRIHLQIADAHSFGKFRDKPAAQKEIDAYRKLCPESTDGGYLNLVSQLGSPQQIATVAAELRKRLESATGEPQRNRWETLWALEFKARPVAEHADVRKRIGEDLARFEKSPQRGEAKWMSFLQNGYESMGDQAAIARLGEEIVKAHPQSDEAKRYLEEKRRKEHPYPNTGDESQRNEWRRADLAEKREWHKRWPEDSFLLYQIYSDLAELPETKPEEVTAAVDEFFAAYRKKAEFSTSPPLEFSIAGAYLKHRARLDQVPDLVEKGYEAAASRARRNDDDRYDDQMAQMMRGSADYLQVERARLLISCYALTKQPEKARAAFDAVKLADPEKQKPAMLAVEAKLAEAEGHKPDAIVLYQAAINARKSKPSGKDQVAEDLERVWKELGGTPERLALLRDKPKAAEATDSRWEKPKNPLPNFTLSDMGGKTWKLASLEGKALLINIWATWCGPCIAEHREFQQLYEKLKDRPDVSVLSFNVDEDLGKVAPYLAEHKYTFPVIPAKDVVDAVVPVLAIPRNWLVTPKGKLEWEQIGYGGESNWQGGMLAKLEEVTRAK